jgi:hypothetical protein
MGADDSEEHSPKQSGHDWSEEQIGKKEKKGDGACLEQTD